MAKIFGFDLAHLDHRGVSWTGMLTGLASFGAIAAEIHDACERLSHIRGVPIHLVTSLDQIGIVFASLGSAAVIIAATGKSITKRIYPDTTPPEGPTNVVPLPLAASEPPLLMDQQKAA